MSKITIPLLMIFATAGFIALAKLDRDGESEKVERWPSLIGPEAGETAKPTRPPLILKERLSREEFERQTNGSLYNIRILPVADDAQPVSFLWPTNGNDEPAHPVLLDIARTESFDGWKSYLDEHVGFYYPDDPDVRVEVVGVNDDVPLLAPEFVPVDDGTFRRYRITAGEAGTLCVISLSLKDEFDDAARAPHPEVFHRFTPSGGGLLRTSFTEQGLVRRAELLGRDVRVSLLDWPQLAIHQDVYLRIASGIKLPAPYAQYSDLRDAAIAKYGLEAKLGSIDRGVSHSDLALLLGGSHYGWLNLTSSGAELVKINERGTSDREQSIVDVLHFRTPQEATKYSLLMRRGMLAGFAEDWRQERRSPPFEDSVQWMFEKTDYRAGEAGGAGYNLGPLTETDALTIFNRIVERAPKAGPSAWQMMCQTVSNLAQHGLRDERFVALARDKLEAPGFAPEPSLLALEACGSEMAKGTIAEHIAARFESSDLPRETLEHFYTLIAFIGQDHPAVSRIIDLALSHQSERVRELGFLYCAWLPEQAALPHLEAGLHERSAEVRRRCAKAFAMSHGDPERHPPMLAARLSQEDDEEVQLLLQKALDRFGYQPGT